ncbi:MerR family transcriptional regulator [Paraprevotella clara]|uniref:MerR family transcriptional regulator n=1 Tax=Paraprevotella clara TaxID=454154 RepID=UPI002FDAD529
MALNPNKELKLYYSIGEVAEMLGVSETLLRYWEKEFPTITPKKSGRNIRQYSQKDIEQVRLIHHLVKVKGMKLAAARKALRNSKGEVERNMEIVGRLQAVREELMQIKKELDGLV